MGSGPAGADDGASARDGKWAWSSIEMSELKMAGGEGKGGIKVGGLGDSLAGVPCHSPPDRQGVRDQNQGAASSGKSPAHEGGALSSARSPHPQLPWLCPVRVAASLKPKAAPLCAQLLIVPPSSFFSPNTHTHTHTRTHSSPRVRRHYCPTQQRPRCSTRFLLLISRCFRHFLTASPIVSLARSGLTRSTIILLSKQTLSRPKDISVFCF